MSDFVNFKLAHKLKEKGFDCKYPFAMYDEDGDFYPLFTSCDEDEDSKCIFGNRMYYGYDDFIGDKDAVIAPTISQVLKWLREEKKLYVGVTYSPKIEGSQDFYYATIQYIGDYKKTIYPDDCYVSWVGAALKGIEYVLDNLI